MLELASCLTARETCKAIVSPGERTAYPASCFEFYVARPLAQ
jgi:hypothetical protein